MPLTIDTNMISILNQQFLTKANEGLKSAIANLSGKANNKPASVALGNLLATNIAALKTTISNSASGIHLVATAQGATQSISKDLQKMQTLAIQAANGTNNASDLAALNKQYQAYVSNITRVTQSTNYNGIPLFSGDTIPIQVSTGITNDDQVNVTLPNSSMAANIANTSIDTLENAKTAITSLKDALQNTTSTLADLGASQTQIQSVIKNNATYTIMLSNAQSSLMDIDYAQESSTLTKNMILAQANIAMLTQAHATAKIALNLLKDN